MDHAIAYRYGRKDYIAMLRASRSVGPLGRLGRWGRAVLLGLFEEMASPEDVELVRELVGLAADHDIPLPNVDLALASMAWATGMPPDAGRTLFTVARVAGWTAHYLEELEERPLRYRARAVYATPGRSGVAGSRSVPG